MIKKICGFLAIVVFVAFYSGCKKETENSPEKTESVSEEKISVYKSVEEYSLYENDYVEIDGVRYTNSNIGLIATKLVDTEISEIELPFKFNISKEVYGDDLFKEGSTLQYDVDLFVMGYADGFITEDNKIEITKLAASEGHVLTNGEVYGKEIYLGIYDCAENWHEITKEEYLISTANNQQ